MFARATTVIVKTSPRPGREIHFRQYLSVIRSRQRLVASSSHLRLETQRHHGLSSVPYQRRTISPKNIQVSAPNARYGPNGNLADQTGFPATSVTKPITEPRSDPAKRLNNTARQ